MDKPFELSTQGVRAGQVRSQFNEQELVDLTLAVVAINGWNRINIAFRTVPGTYQPGTLAAQLAA